MNICSNQIKEVILHRFKVNSLQKLLIHINFLLAFSVLFCSHSAYGQSANPAFGSNTQYQNLDAGNGVIVTVMTDNRAVDLGLSVYWAKYNIGTTDSLGIGEYFAWGETTARKNKYSAGNYTFSGNPDVLDASNDAATQIWKGYWHMPHDTDFVNLSKLQNSFRLGDHAHTFKGKGTGSGNSIQIRLTGFKDGRTTDAHDKGVCGYLWSNTRVGDSKAYSLKMLIGSNGVRAHHDWDRYYGFPIRPVIDKCDNIGIKVKFEDSNPSETTLVRGADYPKGTVLHAPSIDCYDYEWRIAGGTLNAVKNKDIEITSTNVTYSLVYIIKQYNVTAYSNDQVIGSNDQVIGTISPVSKTVNCGESVMLTATPAVCYKLSRWVDLDDSSIVYEPGNSNDEYSCTTNADGTCTLIIKNVRRAMKVKAEFVLKKSNVTIEANPEEGGLVEFANRTN